MQSPEEYMVELLDVVQALDETIVRLRNQIRDKIAEPVRVVAVTRGNSTATPISH